MQFTYTNPVWNGYFADPFVLKTGGVYYAYGTAGAQADGNHFPVLRSPDLANWEWVAGALPSLPEESGKPFLHYWAPEVAERNGKFYLYYSAEAAGDDSGHRLRVAVADRPEGPFEDTGRLLLPDEGFTIDASPFRDPKDGNWYLFFAKDFFDARVGTAAAVVPLADDMLSVAGEVRTVLRPSEDWQIYERNRAHYGQTWEAWHTVEGPFTVYHEGRYYCFYSGGAWHTPDYGVSFGMADDVMGPYVEGCDGGPCILRSVEGKVLGPGHNSVVVGPDDHTLFLVYHAWDVERTARRMCIDPLTWSPDGPRCPGPTHTPQSISL